MMIKAHVNTIVKEYLLGHNLQLDQNYYRPNFEEDVVPEYLKALDLLTINEEFRLQKKVKKLTDKRKDSEYIINGRLQDANKQIEFLMQKQEKN